MTILTFDFPYKYPLPEHAGLYPLANGLRNRQVFSTLLSKSEVPKALPQPFLVPRSIDQEYNKYVLSSRRRLDRIRFPGTNHSQHRQREPALPLQ